MGKIRNYRAIHSHPKYLHAWEHESTGERVAVVNRELVNDDWTGQYCIIRQRHGQNQPRLIDSFISNKQTAKRIALNIVRKNPTGLFNGLNLPPWGHAHHIDTTMGHITILETYVNPSMSEKQRQKRLEKHPKAEI